MPTFHVALCAAASALCGLLAAPCHAGRIIYFECTDGHTHFSDRWDTGGRFAAGNVTGFCASSKKLVTLWWPTSWKAGEKQPSPPTAIRVFDPVTGKKIHMYRSEECKEPFVPIETEARLRRIPPCQGKTFKITGEIDAD